MSFRQEHKFRFNPRKFGGSLEKEFLRNGIEVKFRSPLFILLRILLARLNMVGPISIFWSRGTELCLIHRMNPQNEIKHVDLLWNWPDPRNKTNNSRKGKYGLSPVQDFNGNPGGTGKNDFLI